MNSAKPTNLHAPLPPLTYPHSDFAVRLVIRSLWTVTHVYVQSTFDLLAWVFCFALFFFFFIELSRRLGFDFWISLKFLFPVTLASSDIYIYIFIHKNIRVYIPFHLQETYDVCEKCTQPLESNIKCIMYTRSSVFQTPPRHAPEHTVVIRFGIHACINIYFYVYFSLLFFSTSFFICSNPWLKSSPRLIHHLIWIAHFSLERKRARARARVCTHTYITNFHIIIIKNTSATYSWEKKKRKTFFLRFPTTMYQLYNMTTVRGVCAREKMLPLFLLLLSRWPLLRPPQRQQWLKLLANLCTRTAALDSFFSVVKREVRKRFVLMYRKIKINK